MSVFVQVTSVTEVGDGKKVSTPLTVPAPVCACMHAVIDTAERCYVVFVTPLESERSMADVMARVTGKSPALVETLVKYTGAGCFAPHGRGSALTHGYTLLMFHKRYVMNSITHSVDVRTTDSFGRVLDDGGDPPHKVATLGRVEFTLAFPPNLAELYNVESFSRLLKADYFSADEIQAIVSEKQDPVVGGVAFATHEAKAAGDARKKRRAESSTNEGSGDR